MRRATGPAGPGAIRRLTRGPAVAVALLALYASFWGVKVFSEHRIGNYSVETDFYWKYGPAARDLLHGRVDIANYDSKGWGYPAVVALLSIPGFDPFQAAQILALLSALVAAWLVFHTHRRIVGTGAPAYANPLFSTRRRSDQANLLFASARQRVSEYRIRASSASSTSFSSPRKWRWNARTVSACPGLSSWSSG